MGCTRIHFFVVFGFFFIHKSAHSASSPLKFMGIFMCDKKIEKAYVKDSFVLNMYFDKF